MVWYGMVGMVLYKDAVCHDGGTINSSNSTPVTVEGQKLEIPEDPSQTLPKRSPMDPIW